MVIQSVKFVAIEGHGGSGKSTFADLLSTRLNAQIIHIDDFTGANASDDWYKKLIKYVFEPIANGKESLNYPRAKWWEQHNPTPVTNQPVTPIMIIEGVGSLRTELREYIDYGVFVETPRDVCLKRGLERDKGVDAKSDEEITAWWNKWLDADDEYFARDNPKEYAQLVRDGTKPFDDAASDVQL